MKTILFFLTIFFLCISTFAQMWFNSSNFSPNDRIKNINFINPNQGWIIVENNGNSANVTIKRTTDKGISWYNTNSFSANLSNDADIDIDFVDENVGFRVYYNISISAMVVDKTTNGGFDWYTVFQSDQYLFAQKPSIMFVNTSIGFITLSYSISGGKYVSKIIKTSNSGSSWHEKHYIEFPSSHSYLTDIAFNFKNGVTTLCAVGYHKISSYPAYTNYLRCMSTDLGESFQNITDPGNSYFNSYSSVKAKNTDPPSFLILGVKRENILPQGTYCTQVTGSSKQDYFINDVIDTRYLGGISCSNENKGFCVIDDKVYKTENSGANWEIEFTLQDQVYYCYDVINSFGDIAYAGTWHGQFYTRKISGNYNTNFDWQGSSNWSIAIDGENVPTSSSGYFRGGTVALYANQFQINSNDDTTARFYYWGGNCNASMNYSANSYLINSGSNINADYKTKLKTTTGSALHNANQVKAIKDTNGVTNLIYESMGGIFYTRTKPDGTFKAEEVLSSSSYIPLQGYATFNNKNPYLSENKFTNDKENNVWACWERREGNNIKILGSARFYNENSPPPPNWPKHYWGTNELITLTGVPEGFESMPKIFVAGGLPNPLRVLTYLKPDGANKKIVGKVYTTTTVEHEFDLTLPGNITEYAIAPIYPYYGVTFQLHITYKVDQTVYYKSVKIGQLNGWQGGIQPTYEVLNQETNISSDASGWRASLDIALKNTANSSSSFNMQPVVTYQGRNNVRIIIENEDGPPSELITNNYPIYVKERLPSGEWSSVIVSYNNPNINEPQMNPTIVGSKHRNSCVVSYGRGNSAPYTFMQKVHMWNGSISSGYNCNPISYTANDVKIVKGGLIDDGPASLSQRMMTLSYQAANLFNVGTQSLNISNGIEEDGNFEEISGLIEANNVQYTFNLGNILVNSQNINFANNLDTVIDNIGELNNNLASKPFLLNENDTLIIGRNAAYVLNDPNGAPVEIEYWVRLMNKTKNSEHRLLVHDTLRAVDSVLYEYLEGYIIRDIEGGTDSFYVQLEIDTVDGNFGIGGGLGGDGDGGGDAPNTIKKKIFWENENLTTKGNTLPTEFALYQNFPNPFNPATVIKYDLPKDVKVTVKIYDLLGREVVALVNNEFKNAGRYELNWNAGKYASGVYIYRIEAGDYISTKKMILVK